MSKLSRLGPDMLLGYLPASVRPSLLSVTAGVAGLSAIANAVAIAAPAPEQAPPTRLGNSIQESVRQRDEQLAQQKRALQLREQATKASEERLKADLAARQAEAAQPAAPTGGNRGGKAIEPNEPYDELARIYQTMKPAKAAPIFEKLDLDVQTEVARRMRERSTAQIMSYMNPATAVQLSMSLAGKPAAAPKPQRVAAAPAAAPAPAPRRAAQPASNQPKQDPRAQANARSAR